MEDLFWTADMRKLSDLEGWEANPRKISSEEAEKLEDSLAQFGQVQPIAIDPNNVIVDGHQRAKTWLASEIFGEDYAVDVRVANRALTEGERRKLSVYLHEGATGEWDFDILRGWDQEELKDWGMKYLSLRLSEKGGKDEGLFDPEYKNQPDQEGFSENEGDWRDRGELICPECGHRFDPGG